LDVTLLDYALPEELVAQRPLEARDGARLLVLDRGSDHEATEGWTREPAQGVERDAAELPYGLVPRLEDRRRAAARVAHRTVRELAELVPPALWVVNDTRVLAARLFAHRASGGRVEIFLLERSAEPGRWRALGRASKPLREGDVLAVEGSPARVVIASAARAEDGTIEVACEDAGGIEALLEAAGHVPLPPYIRRPDELADRARYQTVFAAHPGAVAAPTAGLHFTDALMSELEARGHRFARVTLHVGAGTFRPVKSARLEDHPMHAERYVISPEAEDAIDRARKDGMPLVAVGTTVVRTLESAAAGEGRVRAGEGSTRLFIRPGYDFQVVDGLLTNFHQPRSTLIALVMAFAGVDAIRDAYAEAVAARYRFLSYGDAMLIRPRERDRA
jgi:S-adenosylmethionine:tRNA ribosyltransferase-isomerase